MHGAGGMLQRERAQMLARSLRPGRVQGNGHQLQRRLYLLQRRLLQYQYRNMRRPRGRRRILHDEQPMPIRLHLYEQRVYRVRNVRQHALLRHLSYRGALYTRSRSEPLPGRRRRCHLHFTRRLLHGQLRLGCLRGGLFYARSNLLGKHGVLLGRVPAEPVRLLDMQGHRGRVQHRSKLLQQPLRHERAVPVRRG
jgi:hypothetical protein